MLSPYTRPRSARAPCAVDGWTGAGWTLLERHALAVRAPPAVALEAVATLRLRDLPAVRALFSLRRLRHTPDMTLRAFFGAPPFVLLEEDPGRELVFGVLRPGSGPGPRARAPGAPRSPASPEAFRRALAAAPFAAVGTFRAEPRRDGSLLWTETWARTRGVPARAAFAAYWLAIGPWSAWIRRMFLRAARGNAERRG